MVTWAGNALLASLPPQDWKHWQPAFQRVELRLHDDVILPESRVEYLWFPESGVHSQIVASTEGESVEVAIVGREGMLGLPGVFGIEYGAAHTVVQVAGTAMRIRRTDFERLSRDNATLLRRIMRYAGARFASLAQIAACNRLHSAEQRLCRWLLMVRTRAAVDSLPITHELLSLMLGTRRASVSEIAKSLRKRNVIRYSRGVVEFLQPQALHECACECYDVIESLYAAAIRDPL
jgi:CRP-like cAMP-binding protein